MKKKSLQIRKSERKKTNPGSNHGDFPRKPNEPPEGTWIADLAVAAISMMTLKKPGKEVASSTVKNEENQRPRGAFNEVEESQSKSDELLATHF